jgi:hypothetical protein
MSIFGTGYNQGGGGRGFNLRWIIAAVIAIGGIISYIGSRQVNPTTGEVQHVGMNADQEMRLGLQAAPQMAHEMGGAASPNDPDANLDRRDGLAERDRDAVRRPGLIRRPGGGSIPKRRVPQVAVLRDLCAFRARRRTGLRVRRPVAPRRSGGP